MDKLTHLDKLAFAAAKKSREEEYWTKQLEGKPEKCGFAEDYFENAADKQPKPSISQLKFNIDGSLFEKAVKLSTGSHPRMHMILSAGIVLLLEKYTGQKDIMVGTPIYKQNVDTEFINTVLVLRNAITPQMTFKELLLQVRQKLNEAVDNQNYPIEKIIQKLGMPYGIGDDFPLFDAALLLENIQHKSYIRHIKPKIVFSFLKNPDNIEGEIDYPSNRYKQETVGQIAKHFLQLLHEVLEDVNKPLDQISMLTPEEKRYLLEDINDTAREYDKDKTLHRYFEEQVRRTPDHTAVEGPVLQITSGANRCGLSKDKIELTYKQLNERADKLAGELREKGVRANSIVALKMRRSLDMIVAIWAILKAGGAFMPIDPQTPPERIRYQQDDSNARLLLTERDVVQQSAIENGCNNEPDHAGTRHESNIGTGNIAYIIYTSGSTGKPKGVMIEHRSIVNYTLWAARTYVNDGIGTENDRGINFPLYTSIAFDLTITSIFTPHQTGNAVIIYEGDAAGVLLEKVIEENKAAVIKLTPSHLYQVKNRKVNRIDNRVKCFIVGGENLTVRAARELYENYDGKVDIYNEYGPTEATIGCMIYKYDPRADKGKSVPIGKPVDNQRVYILDGRKRPVPVGAAGEIHVSGDGIARGYINRPELTAEKFGGNPFLKEIKGIKGDMLYRTGDRARWNADGNAEFLGRIDQQVKIRGYRIEPGEIENRLLKHRHIGEAHVIAKEDRDGNNYLCAYVVGKTGDSAQNIDGNQLREYLAGQLPDYMMPSYFVTLETIPLTANGKVDRNALPAHDTGLEKLEYEPPANETEEKLVQAWSEILGLDTGLIGVKTDFFQLGGDSLKAIRVIARAEQDDIRLKIKDLFECRTIKSIAGRVINVKNNADGTGGAKQEPSRRQRTGETPLLPAQKMWLQLDHPHPELETLVFLFELDKRIDIELLEKTFIKLIEHHDALRARFFKENGQWKQEIRKIGAVSFRIERITLQNHDRQKRHEERLEEINRIQRGITLEEGLLINAAVFEQPGEERSLFISIHHLVFDNVSAGIFMEDFFEVYNQYENGEKNRQNIERNIEGNTEEAEEPAEETAIRLKPVVISVKEWADRLYDEVKTETLNIEYWKNLELQHSDFFMEHFGDRSEEPAEVDKSYANILNETGELNEEETETLRRSTTGEYGATQEELLLSAFVVTMNELRGMKRIQIDVVRHGREEFFEDVEPTGTVGWFSTWTPVQLEYSGGIKGTVNRTKEIRRGISKNGMHYAVAKHVKNIPGLPKIESQICFNNQGDGDIKHQIPEGAERNVRFKQLSKEGIVAKDPGNIFPYIFQLSPIIFNNRLKLRFYYNRCRVKPETVRQILDTYMKMLNKMIRQKQFPGDKNA